MPSRRYLLVEGVRSPDGHGIPVTNPHAPLANPARFAGWRFASLGDKADVDTAMEHYQPEREVLVDHADLRKAIRAGHLTLHAECVAKNPDAARAALLASMPKPGGA